MRLERYFLTGLAALLPLFVTLWLIGWVYAQSLALFGGLLAFFGLELSPALKPWLPLFGLALAVLLITLFGLLVSNWLGRRLVEGLEALIERLPLIGEIYRAIKQVSTSLFSPQKMHFSRAALIEYPRKGTYALCFVEQEVKNRRPPLPEGHVVVVVPTSPMPASGFVIVVPEDELIPLDIRVEDALRFVVSVGFILPEPQKPVR